MALPVDCSDQESSTVIKLGKRSYQTMKLLPMSGPRFAIPLLELNVGFSFAATGFAVSHMTYDGCCEKVQRLFKAQLWMPLYDQTYILATILETVAVLTLFFRWISCSQFGNCNGCSAPV